ncbi:MAG: sugar ABC transporter ATP-binding protein [Caldilineales bacterium]|nr:sugar ABC transporter ATP-binding protein [Caldilineales bacterium]
MTAQTQQSSNRNRTSFTREVFVLRAQGLRKSFGGVEVLHGVDIELQGGSVLAVLGENGAGKSTAIKIISGAYTADAGRIEINGEEVKIESPRAGQDQGIRVIYQEMTNAPTLSVSENIFLGHLPNRGGFVRWNDTYKQAKSVLADLGVNIDPRREVSDLSVAEHQIVEIARALVADARLLIFDEPTSALSPEEVEHLFALIRRLRAEGVAIIYITHRLAEVPEIADRVIVFRDGYLVAEGPVTEFSREKIVEAMTGETLKTFVHTDFEASKASNSEAPALELSAASLPPFFTDVSLRVYKGEIVSLFGRMGSGALEVGEALFGLRELFGGQVNILGQDGQPNGPRQAKQRGLGFVPIDRKTQGIFANLSAGENITVAAWGALAQSGLLLPRTIATRFDMWRDRLSIRGAGGSKQEMDTLSGGNQQKVVLGRWLENKSSVLVLAEPTRGVDVGARAEIYEVLEALADEGMALLVISTDAEEVLRISDRIIVMSDGRVTDEIERADASMARLAASAAAVSA